MVHIRWMFILKAFQRKNCIHFGPPNMASLLELHPLGEVSPSSATAHGGFVSPWGYPNGWMADDPLNKQFAIENCPVEIVEKNPAIKYGWIFHGYVSEILPEGNVT